MANLKKQHTTNNDAQPIWKARLCTYLKNARGCGKNISEITDTGCLWKKEISRGEQCNEETTYTMGYGECFTRLLWLKMKDQWNYICNALRDLVPFVQFRKRQKYP